MIYGRKWKRGWVESDSPSFFARETVMLGGERNSPRGPDGSRGAIARPSGNVGWYGRMAAMMVVLRMVPSITDAKITRFGLPCLSGLRFLLPILQFGAKTLQ